ncbi:PEP-CTERM sorting domain-containing protein [Paludisphaera mucosa]|uniref:PEP-CTERM sorting domain-containing protein n=1 Tax=Paludisphaera mucosa TaxID=3030827 RepID=A0ABT6FL28_9BACT|nr:PEP-CTERM sorting domain-containing protein [Paludisphaera mucosa]MDG3008229.1 PEP-CTERM sorting domain-containing protein [Paludisphaera mucosa]
MSRRMLRFVFFCGIAARLAVPAHAGFMSGKIIVDATGVAGMEESIRVKSTVVAPPRGSSTEQVKFTPAAADVANAAAKAAFIAAQINAQSVNQTAAAVAGVVTVTPVAGRELDKISFNPGKSGEVLRINPEQLSAGLGLNYDLELTGVATLGFAGTATLSIGGPGGGDFSTLTSGLTASQILLDLETQINTTTSLGAMIIGNSLILTNVTTSNDIAALVTDSGFSYSYGVTAVPEPSTLAMGATAALAGLAALRRRRV